MTYKSIVPFTPVFTFPSTFTSYILTQVLPLFCSKQTGYFFVKRIWGEFLIVSPFCITDLIKTHLTLNGWPNNRWKVRPACLSIDADVKAMKVKDTQPPALDCVESREKNRNRDTAAQQREQTSAGRSRRSFTAGYSSSVAPRTIIGNVHFFRIFVLCEFRNFRYTYRSTYLGVLIGKRRGSDSFLFLSETVPTLKCTQR